MKKKSYMKIYSYFHGSNTSEYINRIIYWNLNVYILMIKLYNIYFK